MSVPEQGDILTAAGYGMSGYPKISSQYLKSIELEVVGMDPQNPEKLETTVGENNEGPCAGDSGGPLLVNQDGQWKLVATLIGHGFDCRTNRTNGHDMWSVMRGVMADVDIEWYNGQRQN